MKCFSISRVDKQFVKRQGGLKRAMRKDVYQQIKKIYKTERLLFALRFEKVTAFHITFEMLITVYILELFTTLTAFFLNDPTKISKTILLIVFPLIIAAPLSLIYASWCAIYCGKINY